MKRRIIYIYHENSAYVRRLAGRLALILRGAEIHIAERKDLDDPKKEVFAVERYDSAENTAAKISQCYGTGKTAAPLSCVITGFTSGCGGCGTSSAAVMYGRILSQFYELKVLYLSLDRIAVKCSPFRSGGREDLFGLISGRKTAEQVQGSFGRDSYGMYYMVMDEDINPCSYLEDAELAKLITNLGGFFDRIVMDVPISSGPAFAALELCDNAVVCFGWKEELRGVSESLADILSRSGINALRFSAAYDADRSMDLFGQFGAEVRGLAQSIEGKQNISSENI